MVGKAWDNQTELSLLRQLVEQGLNDAQVVEQFAVQGYERTYKSVQRKRQNMGWRAHVQPSQFALDKPAVLQADRALLLFDIHAPLHKASWLNRVIDLALKWGVDAVGVGGDIVDFSSVSYWGRSIGIELQDELNSGCMIVNALVQNFSQRMLCGGNHEYRLVRKLDGALRMKEVLDYFVNDPTTVTTNRKWFWLESGGMQFRIVHPKNYSRIPARVAQSLASKYRCNMITGHGHLWGMTRDVSGGWWAIDAGCCLDARKVNYLEEDLSTNPQPVLGAVIVIDGMPILLGKENIELYEKMAL